MKTNVLILFAILISVSCGKQTDTNKGGDDSRFYVGENSRKITTKNREKFPEWIEIGVECYGLILLDLNKGDKMGIPVKVQITKEKQDGYQCTTLEDVMFYEQIGCDKLTTKKGESWWETEGDIFKTKEEAIAYLRKNDWYFDF